MSDDLERVERALARSVAPQVREGVVERRQGVISVVNTNGTVDVTVGGVIVPGVRYKAWYSPVLNDVVFVEVVGTDFVVDGPVAAASPTPSPWVTWNPVIVQNGTRAIANTLSRYKRLHQQTVIGYAMVTIANAGTAGTFISGSLPDAPFSDTGLDMAMGSFILFRAGGTRYAGTAAWSSALGALAFIVSGTTNAMGADPSFALGIGDKLSYSFHFEADSV